MPVTHKQKQVKRKLVDVGYGGLKWWWHVYPKPAIPLLSIVFIFSFYHLVCEFAASSIVSIPQTSRISVSLLAVALMCQVVSIPYSHGLLLPQ